VFHSGREPFVGDRRRVRPETTPKKEFPMMKLGRESTRHKARDLAAAVRREDVRRDVSRLFRDLRALGNDFAETRRRRRWPALAGMAALAGAAGGAAWWLRRHNGEAEVDLGRTAHMAS
jgi:hypothetical protein